MMTTAADGKIMEYFFLVWLLVRKKISSSSHLSLFCLLKTENTRTRQENLVPMVCVVKAQGNASITGNFMNVKRCGGYTEENKRKKGENNVP